MNFPLFHLANQNNEDISITLPKIEYERKNEIQIKINDEISTEKSKIKQTLFNQELNDECDLIFDNPQNLFEYVIKNKRIKKYFNKELQEIIKLIEKILYSPPYNILFGRINIQQGNKNFQENKNSNAKNVNESFYEGFGIQ